MPIHIEISHSERSRTMRKSSGFFIAGYRRTSVPQQRCRCSNQLLDPSRIELRGHFGELGDGIHVPSGAMLGGWNL